MKFPDQRLPFIFAMLVLWVGLALALTPPERKLVERILQQAEIAKGANTALKLANLQLTSEAAQAHVDTKNANDMSVLAISSAITTGLKAKTALDEAERCKTENERMRAIVEAVSGPWWFPGLHALGYGIKKCSISLLVIVAGIVVILVVIKFITGVSFGGLITPIINFFAGLPGKIMALIRRLKPKPSS